MKQNKIINDINGMIILNKPKDMTSNDCLSIIKKSIHPKKIGHTGTLDKNATGVLICLLGSATKSQDYLMKTCKKCYRAELVLGISTDTEDITGNIIEQNTNKILDISDDELKSTIESFIGEYSQVPPMYSAKKVNGTKLLKLARNGIEIERKAELLTIHNIEIENIANYKYNNLNLKCVNIFVECSKGTYIRTLCKDIGIKLGIPACMGNLCRVASGEFELEDSVTVDELKEKISLNDWSFVKPCFYNNDETALTFGKFETLHLGHLKIINEVVSYAKENKLKSTVMIVGNNSDNEILTNAQRISKLKLLGVNNIVYFPLDKVNKNISANDFITNILYKQLKTRCIIVGSDCSFGAKASGNIKLLNDLCESLNIKCKIINKLKINNTDIDISSTYIKSEYLKGNKILVNKLLGKDYE
ncbi:MAG: tRNA pseudouridine(55) synthase TruB [Lachnospiraceae bacterium]|nr:tRNA pseudouridine(55) synthase TruB [Lachnospiraceae bacterium]